MILVGSYAKRLRSDDYPWAPEPVDREAKIQEMEETFGNPEYIPDWIAPSLVGDLAFRNWLARYFRFASSPRAAAHLLRMNTLTDTREALPLIAAPTLCLYRTKDQDVNVEEGRWISSQIPNSRFVEIEGRDHLLVGEGMEEILDEIEEFVTGTTPVGHSDRSLATVMFTDIVGSTERAAAMGDGPWTDLLRQHGAAVRTVVAEHRGRLVGDQGDGVLATFDGPARAVRAAEKIHEVVAPLDLSVRIGVHTGEVQHVGMDVAGLAVHIGARVADKAVGGETLVSRTVRDLIVGSGIDLEPKGSFELKGVPDSWELFAVGRSS